MKEEEKKVPNDNCYDNIEKALDSHSANLSSSIRIIALSIIAALWAFSNSDSLTINPDMSYLGIKTFLGAVLTLTLDALQHLFGYWAYSKAFDQYRQGEIGDELFEDENVRCLPWLLYKITFICFTLKLVVIGLTAVAFLVIICNVL